MNMKIMYRNFIYEAVSVTDTPAFKAWFGNSKVVDDNGDPLNVFHGTTRNFEVFDIKKAYKDSYVGKGFYFTSSTTDADTNYAGLGPDAENKVSWLVEEWDQIEDFEELSNVTGIDVSEIEKASSDNTLNTLLKAKAKDEIIGEHPAPNIMPVYLKIENPFYIGDEFKQYFDYNIPFNEETEEEGEPEGEGVTLLESLREELDNLEYIEQNEIFSSIIEELQPYDGGFTSTQFYKAIKNAYALSDAYYGEEQNYTGEFIKRIILRARFDGIIMDASVFENMKGTRNSTHYIVYNPNQIKSIYNKNPSDDPNITKE
ncbi:MAG: hypothetical protein WC358_06760 [Ignavibacteria bacterium]